MLAVFAVAGCATLSEDECLAGNWRIIGYEDGALGQPRERVGAHAEACARYGVSPDLETWRLGYEEGLASYCTRPSGFLSGVGGAVYQGVCTGEAAQVFLTAYTDGRTVYDVRQAYDAAWADHARVEREIARAREDRDQERNAASAPDIEEAEREAHLDAAEELSERIGRLEGELLDIDLDIDRIDDDRRRIEQRMRFAYPEWSGN
jgi:hypothetical protein